MELKQFGSLYEELQALKYRAGGLPKLINLKNTPFGVLPAEKMVRIINSQS